MARQNTPRCLKQGPPRRLLRRPSYPARSLTAVSDLMTGQDYAGAVSAERGRCFRFVYDEHGKPERCPEPMTRTGWLYLVHPWKWYPVDSCERHVGQLEKRPRPPRPSYANDRWHPLGSAWSSTWTVRVFRRHAEPSGCGSF